MQQVDSLIHARWIVPVEPQGAILENHAIVVDRGRVVDLLPSAEAETRYEASACHRLANHLLMPGLVNAHTHAPMNLLKGLADDLPLMEWLEQHIWPAEGRWVNDDFVYDGTRLAAAEMLRSGTTCFNDMYFFPGDTARAAVETGIRATVGLIVLDFPSVWAADADEYIARGIEVHDRYRSEPLIETAFAPHAPYTVADEALRRVGVLAEELDIPVHIHVHETADEVARSQAQYKERPLERLARLGLLSPHLVAVHMTQLEDAEIERIAECAAHIVHCPESNLKLASGFCPVGKLLGAGVPVALGTDGAASNNDLDMIGEMRTSALLAKGVSGSANTVSAHQALRMATLNGARALGLDERIGSLVPGKEADMVAVNLGTIETQPVYEPVSQLVYSASRTQVSDVWVAGRHVLANRELATVDEGELLASAATWQQKIGAPAARET